jgi:predicted phosphoribosyltransferase
MRNVRIVSDSFDPFADREEAGRLLGWELHRWRRAGAVVLGLQGGGLVVARELAATLEAELDVVLSRKMRAPGRDEMALGSVPETGDVIVSESVVEELGVPGSYIAVEKELQEREMLRRSARLRRIRPKVPLAGRTVVLTDEGVATGASMQAALWAIRQENPRTLLVAIPVGPEESVVRLARDADSVVCLKVPHRFSSVEHFYLNYDSVDEEKVFAILWEQQAGAAHDRARRPKMRQPARYFLKAAFERYFL